MSGKIDDLIPSAKELRKQASIKEAEKAEERLRWTAAADADARLVLGREVSLTLTVVDGDLAKQLERYELAYSHFVFNFADTVDNAFMKE